MKSIYKIFTFFVLIVSILFISSCTDEMDIEVEDPQKFGSEAFFSNETSYKQFLAKLYGGLALSGVQGPAGNSDISGIDEGFGQYLRAYWVLNQVTTDEAIIGWGDGNLPSLNIHNWSSNNEFIHAMFARCIYQVSVVNEFLRQTTDEKLNSRNVSIGTRNEIRSFRAEARFLRALSYWHGMDMFANIPFVTENDPVGFQFPQQKDRNFIYNYIVSELNAIDADLKASGTNEYGRIDKVAAKMLLAKVHLNANVYINQNKDVEAAQALSTVLSSTYSINTSVSYPSSFMADNDVNGAQSEIIFPIRYDGTRTQTFGGTQFLVHASVGGNMNPSDFGITGGWWGLRARPEFFNKFNGDTRGMFFTNGQTLSIGQIGSFTNGYAVSKWKNIKVNGQPGSNLQFVDTDFPMFRLADAYLMYAELVLKGQGTTSQAVTYINILRQRAGVSNISSGDLSLDFVLDERARELYWEGHRRQDLIRFGKYTGSTYNWQWKGNVQNGAGIDAKYKIFPIPSVSMNANPNLKQNDGY